MNHPGGNHNASKVQKVMVQPINLIFKHFQSRSRVKVWLFDHKDNFIEGQILGFDEFMNLVLDNAVEIKRSKNQRAEIGRILLKGENISLIQSA